MKGGEFEYDPKRPDKVRHTKRSKTYNGSGGVQLFAAPLKVEQDIALTLPEYAVCSFSWAK